MLDVSSTWGWGVAITAAAIFGCLAVLFCVAVVYGCMLCVKIHKRGAGGGGGGESEMAESSVVGGQDTLTTSPRSPRARV